ncbi:MAG: lipase maturation factor family protein [Planctomycetes bacterium]|nr:lipase maturation factor family protein [Planctomycetota bacterium]
MTRPILLYDGDCGFCRSSVSWLVRRTGDAVDVRPFPAAVPDEVPDAVELVEPDGRRSRAAAAACRALAYAPGFAPMRLLPAIPGIGALLEVAYRSLAKRRGAAAVVLRAVAGADPTPSSFLFARRLFLALLGLVFVACFVDLGLDARMLLGERGIVPLERVASWDQHAQPAGFLAMPSLFWLARGDTALFATIGVGLLGALCVLAGRFVRAGLLLAAVAWLSFLALALPPAGPEIELGNPFFGAEADALLVETAVLALFVTSLRKDRGVRVAGGAILLLRLLLVRVLVGDAISRLAEGGAWSSTAEFVRHLWTAPLPTRLGLAMHDLPAFVQSVVHVGIVACSLVAPWFVLAPRRLRTLGFCAIALLAAWTALLETRGPWPILVFALALFALDDQTLACALRRAPPAEAPPRRRPALATIARTACVAAFLVLAVGAAIDALSGTTSAWRAPFVPYFACNAYGTRFVVPASHPITVIDAGVDVQRFEALEPRAAPSDLYRAPPWTGLVLPRFDQRLEYAAQGLAAGAEPEPWLLSTIAALLERRGGVRGLFQDGAYQTSRPVLVRLRTRPLRPADPAERSRSEMWWFQGEDLVAPRVYGLRDGVLVEAR